ncbi:MAG: alpha/beta hydrolase [Rikenellaceae bacterium]|nr:alpha/beta hydrolase [Rikenellaceae bacterium]
MKKFFILLLAVIALCGCGKNLLEDEIYTEVYYTDIQYGISDRQNLSIWRVTDSQVWGEAPVPVVVFIHGGGWNNGDKKDWDVRKASVFASHGIMSVSLNYRLSPYPCRLDDDTRIKHPAHVQDAARAVKWIHDYIAEFGGDAGRITVVGHSAGAQIVSLLATDEKYLKEVGLDLSDLDGAVALDGGAYMTLSPMLFAETNAYHAELKSCYLNAFGSQTDDHIDACPYYHVASGKHIPPFLLVYQRNDEYRAIPNKAFANRLTDNGIRVETCEVSHSDHNSIFESLRTYNDSEGITKRVIGFVSRPD